MYRRNFLYCLIGLGVAQNWACTASGQEPAPRNLTVEEVVRLTRNGFSEELIITKIKKNARAFDLSTDELVDLRKAGVSDEVIKYMLDPSQPYTPPANPKPAADGAKSNSAKKYPADPLANRVPAEPGLYFFSKPEAPFLIDLKFFLGTEEKKSLMKKGKTTAYLVGAAAKARLASAPVFYVRLPEGREIAELVLLRLDTRNGRRELNVGPPGPKQQLDADDILQFDTSEAGPRLFKISPPKLAPGQYVLFFIGSAEPAKGVYGKGYDFGIDASARPPQGEHKKG